MGKPPYDKRKLFGTDGIRGVANQYPMTCEVALALGRAVAMRARQGEHRHRVVIGKDTRLSCYMLEMAIASGVCSMGVDVVFVGPLPTPAVAFLTRSMRADAGVMISASHNPYEDNGIKLFARDGFKLPDTEEEALEALMGEDAYHQPRPTCDAVGKAHRLDDAVGRYIEFVKNGYPVDDDLSGLKIVIDCAHGAAYKIAPTILRELGAEVVAIGVTPDGRNINAGCGALHPEFMAKVVRETGADVGLALDGDADRLIVVDEHGDVIDGDCLLAIAARDMLTQGTLTHKTVVATVMSNLGLDRAVESWGGKVVRTQVGDRYVVEKMRAEGFILGGESSGHVLYLDHATTGDGLLAGLRLLASLRRTQQPLSELRKIYQPMPHSLVNIPVKIKRPIHELKTLQDAIAIAEGQLGRHGRVMVRYSGTENKARVLVEGPDKADVDRMATSIADVWMREAG